MEPSSAFSLNIFDLVTRVFHFELCAARIEAAIVPARTLRAAAK